MVLRFYPTKDATVYEKYPEINTGLDAVLDISRVLITTGSVSSSYNSRALISFNYTAISSSILALGQNPNLFTYKLKLYVTEANEVPLDYSIYCYPISQSWDMGVGRFSNSPATTEGVSWKYRLGKTNLASAWTTSSFAVGTTGSWTNEPGGGTWYTASVATQSFSYTTSDLNIDVSSIVRQVQSGSIVFNGFILKNSPEVEMSTTGSFSSLKFFSMDTHTVYSPVLEASYDDSVSAATLSLINTDENITINAINIKSSYSEASTPLIRFSSRYTYPATSFATSSGYLTRYRLPAGTQYAVKSAHSDDYIIDFDSTTKLSDDATSNYIKLHLDSFQPERYYKVVLKVPNSGSNTVHQIYDAGWIFKVSRS